MRRTVLESITGSWSGAAMRAGQGCARPKSPGIAVQPLLSCLRRRRSGPARWDGF